MRFLPAIWPCVLSERRGDYLQRRVNHNDALNQMSTRRQRHEALCQEFLSDKEKELLAGHVRDLKWARGIAKRHQEAIWRLQLVAMDRAKGRAA